MSKTILVIDEGRGDALDEILGEFGDGESCGPLYIRARDDDMVELVVSDAPITDDVMADFLPEID